MSAILWTSPSDALLRLADLDRGFFVVVEPWLALALGLGVPAIMKLLMLMWATRGVSPKERVAIIKALAELFRAGSWRSIGAQATDDSDSRR
ncbi:hypothetical protein ADK66_03060 [Micromonospora sp. NRRL B-16802]|nr:hypothetical protein ADK66_03060 [Micromonospora sp. NRRL B-16802]